jgi:PAS domain S-box-containing protein
MAIIDLRAVRQAYDMRAQEVQGVVVGSAALAVVCMSQAGVIGGLVWYACAMGALLAERMIYQCVMEEEKTSRAAEWLIGAGSGGVTIAYMAAGVIMTLDGRPWQVVGGVSMTFICLMNSGHFRKISPRVGMMTRAPIVAVALATPLLGLFAGSADSWLGPLLMVGLSALGMALVIRHIGSKEQTEAQLAAALAATRSQEYLVRLVLEQEQRTITMMDRDMSLLMVNRNWAASIGVEPEAVIGKSFYDVVPDTPEHWREAHRRAFAGEHVRNERDLIVQDDKSRCWRWEVMPWRDAKGEIGGILTFGEEITQYYLAEREAEDATQILNLAMSAASAGVWRLDFARRTIWTSPEYVRIFGEVPSFRDFASAHPSWLLEEDYERYEAIIRTLSKPGARATIDHRLKTDDTHEIWVHSVMEAIADETGSVRWIVGMTHDVSERKAIEAGLLEATRQAERNLATKRSMFDSILRDLEGVAPTSDLAVAEGEPRDSRVDLAELFERFMRVLREIDLRDAALLEAVRALRSAREAADSANVAKSQFLANMSHELRTPLNAIIGFSEILAEDAAAKHDEAALADLVRIRNAGKSLLSLINSILDLSKIEAGAMDLAIAEYDPAATVREALDLISPVAEKKRITLKVVIASDLGRGVSDAFKLRQCLLNLLSNAAKFTNEGGLIALRAARRRESDGDWLVFEVADNGIGMAEAQMARLFQAFAQADPSITQNYGGTGLGLSITQRLAAMMGGEVAVKSALGEGSTFTLRVPATLWAAADDLVPTEAPADDGSALVLVIDDEPNALLLARRTLDRLGFRFVGTATAEEGLRMARERSPALIVVDIGLPDRSGWEVLQALRDDPATAKIPSIVVSISDDRARAMELGACQHLVKPVERDLFAAAIVRFARSDGRGSPQPARTQERAEPSRAEMG